MGLREVLWRLAAAFRRGKLDADTEAEMRAHLEMEVEAAVRRGLTREQAEREARLRAGTISAALEEVRDQRAFGWLDGAVLDLRQAFAALLRRPGFALLTTAALASAVACNTLVFSVADGVLLRPLPYPDPDRLVRVFESTPRNPKFPISILNYLEDRRASRSLESIALYTRKDLQLTHDDRAESLTAVQITEDFLPTLGVQPILGRNFERSETVGSVRVALLSHRLWTVRFNGDPTVLGRTLRLDRESWTIVGVLPAGFQHVGGSYRSPLQGDTVAVWTPLRLDLRPEAQRNWHFTNAIARLRRGVSPAAAEEDLDRILDDLAARFPDSYRGARATVVPLAAEVLGPSRQTVDLLMAAGALVLCLAGVNIAGLCVARVMARRQELAIRDALGARRGRLVRAVLSENLVVGAAGGIVGLAAAAMLFPGLRFIIPEDFPRIHEIQWSVSGALFAIGIALAVSVLAGLVPALQQTRVAFRGRLSEDPRTSSATREARLLRGGLVVCEVALACVLCFGTILLLRSSIVLGARDHGFDPSGVLTLQLVLPGDGYQKREQAVGLYEALLRRWREIPGVRAAGLATNLPWSGYDENTSFDIVGRQRQPGESVQARFQSASPGFFEALRFRLLRGRLLEERDAAGAPRVVVVNEALARRFFSGSDPVGRILDIWGEKRQIVGVVADVRDRPADAGAEPAFWWPIAQQPFGSVRAVVRTDGDPLALVSAVTGALRALDRELPAGEIATMDALAADAQAERRFMLSLFQAFAALAIALAALGIYGLLATTVRQRRKELGIRMALGATRFDVLSTVVRNGALLASAGIVLGLALAPAAGRALSVWLYGVEETDSATLLAVPLVILSVSLLASVVPGWAAARLEPISILRDQ